MENVLNNYKNLIQSYEAASKHFQETGSVKLLSYALEALEKFERKFIECWSVSQLMEMQDNLEAQGLMTI
ncbi:hypothetical protein [Alteribacillus sp. HJP-4]|uniref:hypothetical protein n=1 Tax=Alteribacillus sp. HJP-4 TaxID=2775394 RepID=UPI0035CD3687